MPETISLNELSIGDAAVVCHIKATGSIKRRFLDIGLVSGTQVECIGISPMGDPTAYLIRGAVIAIRNEDSKDIFVKIIN